MRRTLSAITFPAKGNVAILKRVLLCSAMVNLLIVAGIGVLLRSYPYLHSFPFTYKNILHGHSHFAFGGWVFPALILCILNAFPEVERKVSVRHCWILAVLTLFSAYGMLISFSLMGYKAISIVFSTLSIAVGYYFTIVVWKALRKCTKAYSHLFLKAGLCYMCLATLGPFATGPLITMGKTGTPVYFDVIYFYLHFQYNGWFVFAVLALFYRWLEGKGERTNGRTVYVLLNVACIPAYCLSILWHQPPVIFNTVGGMAALLQCAALFFIAKDVKLLALKDKWLRKVLFVSFICFGAKCLLQLLSALPFVARLAYLYRNFVIAYLHLVLLGFISLFIIGYLVHSFRIHFNRSLRLGFRVFITAFVVTESLLVGESLGAMLGFSFTSYTIILLLCSVLLPVGVGMIAWGMLKGQGNK